MFKEKKIVQRSIKSLSCVYIWYKKEEYDIKWEKLKVLEFKL